jgi:hydrophobic/amphiphilic exporter-1 (mainly G- bacteria), HAE1 family
MSLYLKVKTGDYNPPRWNDFFAKRLTGDVSIPQRIRFAVLVLIVAFGICSSAFFILPHLDREVLPKVDQGQFLIKVEMPLGSRLEITDRVTRRLEEAITKESEVKDVAVAIGSEKSRKGQVEVETLRPSQALMTVTLNKKRKRSSADIVRSLQETVKGIDLESAQVDFVLQESEFAFAEGGIKPILVEVKGYDFVQMGELVERIKQGLAKLAGVYNVQDDMGKTSPETKLNIDKRRAGLYAISALDISLTAKAAIDGVVATQYREAGREYDILVQLDEEDRRHQENLNNLLLYSHVLDALIPLKEVATIEKSIGPSEIRRTNQERTIIVSADIGRTVKVKDVLPKVQKMLQSFNVSPESGLHVALSGKAREIKESFDKVFFAFMLALMLVYMIMAAQFESFSQPFIIMITVPLAFFGITLALLISGTTVNVISSLGAIILVGTVVSNGIVLIETINERRDDGMDIEEAAIEAARVRTRPILMSTFTSVIALIPLALGLGEGAELRSPMAVTMMGGILSSTFLTLVVLPCFYIVVTRGVQRFMGNYEEEEIVESESTEDPRSDS